MKSPFSNYFKGSKKYFSTALIFGALILLTGFFAPLIIGNAEKNWQNKVEETSQEIESEVKQIFWEKQEKLVDNLHNLKSKVRGHISKRSTEEILKIFDNEEFKKYSIQIYNDKEELIIWSKTIAIPEERFFPLRRSFGETGFYRGNLTSYFSVVDTIGNNKYFISLSLPLEKHYKIQNKYFTEVSLSEKLNTQFLTSFKIDYSRKAERSKDGRERSFSILNNFNNKIGVVTFTKPLKDNYINGLKEFFVNLQSGFAVLAFIFLSIALYNNLSSSGNKFLKSVFLILFLVILRFLFFILKIPSKFISGALTDPSYFASKFGFGIVKSPVEFFVTVIFLLLICIIIFERTYTFLKDENSLKNINPFFLISGSLISSIMFLILLRGFSASVRSIIFDSALRYFKEPGLIPNVPVLIMQLGILFAAISIVLLTISLVLFNLKLIFNYGRKFFITFFSLFAGYQITGIIFDALQNSPQGTPAVRIFFIFLIFIISYKIIFEKERKIFNYVFFALIASLISIVLLNYYNTQLEKESLKTTAIDLTRTNESWLEFVITEALINSSEREDVKRSFTKGGNSVAEAFKIWSQSSLQRNNLNSSVALLDGEKRVLGSFGINIPEEFRVHPEAVEFDSDDIKIFRTVFSEKLGSRIVSGIIPVHAGTQGVVGYVNVTVLFKPNGFKFGKYPGFISNDLNVLNNTVNFEDLNILIFENNELVNSFGEIIPSNENTGKILNANFNQENEAWLNLKISDENFLMYALKTGEKNNQRIFVTALKEKNLSWGLYNFLKIFFLHSMVILIFLILYFGMRYKEIKTFGYTFRAQLLISFLIISIVPLLFLGYYNKKITDERNLKEITYQLRSKALDVQKYISENNSENVNRNLLFKKASEDLNVNFSIFENKKNIFGSQDEFVKAGLLRPVMDPEVYLNLREYGYKEFLSKENTDKFQFHSFYLKSGLNGKEIVINVNNMFNDIYTALSGEEVNIFLFGSYSLAVILIIIFSAFFANRISSPIKKLTGATSAVAGGDLDYEVVYNSKGEIKDLVSGFNYMISELKKNQVALSELEREIAWKEMARQVAHEIKNPLTPMKLAIQQLVIAHKDKSPKFDMILEKVSKTVISQIEILSNIASEFSAFARMPNLKLEKIDLVHTVEDSVNLFLQEKIKFEINKEKEIFEVKADKDQLKRTIINLIRNSIQAGADKITINISGKDEFVIFEFEDNGEGIPPQNIEKVFEHNFTTKEKGMGLGLKMAKKFIESIGGKIYVSEANSSGAKFVIHFKKN